MKLDCKWIVNFGEIKDQPGQIRIQHRGRQGSGTGGC